MLAMVVNDNAGWQAPRGVLRFIASKLAPTGGIGRRCYASECQIWRLGVKGKLNCPSMHQSHA
ncbi:hypothetical protein D3C76_492370 [compost metagenome]|nr:hypothetical protein C1X65_05580 [Pseudomonas sp. FW305-70]